MEKLIELLGGVIFVGGLTLIVYFIAHYTYLTKKLLAEKGLLEGRKYSGVTKLDIAYVSIGIGIGVLISAGLGEFGVKSETLDSLRWGIVLIAGAAGLLLASKKKR